MRLYIPIKPMGCVRMTRNSKWMDKNAIRYLDYKTELGYYLKKQCPEPLAGPVKVRATFYMPIPESWAVKKKLNMAGRPMVSKPDIDNLLKGLFDAANGILWADDKDVHELLSVRKVYDETPGIWMEVTTDDDTTAVLG